MDASEPQRVTADAGGPTPCGAARLAIGDVIDRYRVDEVLGVGGMGMVVRAHDLDLDRDVALKVAVAASDPARDRRHAELLLREAQTMARLRVRHVRAVHDIGSARGIDYIAMEYIAGVDLACWLTTPRSAAEIAGVFADAGRGLAAAHAAGVLHRDFKPSNVLVGHDGEVVVTDFGLSRWLHEPRPADAAGTPRYMAPDADPSDPRTDQYSFCVALGEALAQLPAGRLRVRLARVVRRGSAAAAADRYPSMAAVVAELEDAVRRRRWPFAIAGIAAAGIAAVALAGRSDLAGEADRAGRSGDRAAEPRPGDATDAAANRPIDLELDQARALAARGYLRSARQHAEAADAMAQARAPRRRAASRYQVGFIALLQQDTSAARAALEEAVQLADEGGDDRLRARALLALLQAAATRGSELDVADRAERAAAAAFARVASEPAERARLRFFQGVLAARHGREAERARMFAEARGLVTPPTAGDLIEWSEILRSQAGWAAATGDLEPAIAMLREVVATADEIAGRDHMTAISTRGQLASVLEAAGRDAEADAVMTELRAVGRTAAGARLLDEIVGPPRSTHVVHVAVRDRGGAPVAGAMVVAATRFHGNAVHLLGASSLYTEREHATAIGVSDARGIVELAVAEHVPLWFAAEHAAIGRSSPIAATGDAVDLALLPWGTLSGTAPAGAQISLTPEHRPDAPPIVLRATAQGRFASERIPRGSYLAAFCVRLGAIRVDDVERCSARRAVVLSQPAELALSLPTGPGSLVVRPRDELARPIESSYVVLVPDGYTPGDLPAFDTGWKAIVARRPEAFVGRVAVHDTAPARFTGIPAGRYALCAAAIHGDTEDPSFAVRLDARRTPLPLFCTQVAIGDGAVERDLVVPASRRVWLGSERRAMAGETADR